MDVSTLPLVSIVTPSFNQGRFLRRTVDSVLGQDYPRLEYLVMDGGSTDESAAILRTYGDRFFWVSQPDRGQADAINQGMARARGEILAYLNSDDLLLPGAVSAAARHFTRHPEVDLLYGQAFHIDKEDRILERYPTQDFDFARLIENCFICQPAAFWRRRIAQRVGPLDEDLHYAMDYDYWLRIARGGGRIVHVPEFLACSRLHAQTKTLSARLHVYQEIFEVGRRHAGSAGFAHYLAYWQHRLHQRRRGWPRLLRSLPDAAWWLALLQSRWHRNDGRLLSWCADLARSLRRRLQANV